MVATAFPADAPPAVAERRRIALWPQSRRLWSFVACLLVIYLLKQVFFVFAFQPFTGHDEVAHYSYIETLATEARVPQLPDLTAWRQLPQAQMASGFDQIPAKLYPYCRYAIVGWHCEPRDWNWERTPPRMVTLRGELYPTGYQYTANHPPLYYALMAPIYKLSTGWSLEAQQYALRLAAIPFGVLTVLLALWTVRELFPGDAFLAVTVPAFVAFQPQISYEAAMINNDIAAIAFFSLVIYLVMRGVCRGFSTRLCFALGAALGLAILAKSTSIIGAPIIAVAIIATVGWRAVGTWLQRGIAVIVPALVLIAPWYLYLYRTYGNFDALAQIQALQFWNVPAGTFSGLLLDREFLVMRFRETWGEFGWRLIPLQAELLWAIAVPIAVGLVGLVVYTVRAVRRRGQPGSDTVSQPARPQAIGLVTLALVCAVGYLAVVQFGTQFQLTQARYFFPVVNAAAILVMLGLRTLLPAHGRRVGQGIVFAGLVALNVAIFVQYVLPQFVSI